MSERGDSAHQTPDVEHGRRDAGLPLPHNSLPPLPEGHEVQQDQHN